MKLVCGKQKSLGNASGTAQITIVLKDDGGTVNGRSDVSPPQTFAISITKPYSLHNAASSSDVTGDGSIAAGDAVAVINRLNAFGSGPIDMAESGAPYLDTRWATRQSPRCLSSLALS
jgi:hypothetical protein